LKISGFSLIFHFALCVAVFNHVLIFCCHFIGKTTVYLKCQDSSYMIGQLDTPKPRFRQSSFGDPSSFFYERRRTFFLDGANYNVPPEKRTLRFR
jgi:hypothetical protein